MPTRNFIPRAASGLSADGGDRTPGTPPGRLSTSFCEWRRMAISTDEAQIIIEPATEPQALSRFRQKQQPSCQAEFRGFAYALAKFTGERCYSKATISRTPTSDRRPRDGTAHEAVKVSLDRLLAQSQIALGKERRRGATATRLRQSATAKLGRTLIPAAGPHRSTDRSLLRTD